MKIKDHGNAFVIWLSADDTYRWARRPGAAWSCSTLSGHRVVACFDTNGLCDLSIDGKDAYDVDAHELSACVADHARARIKPDHPCYFVAVGQFLGGEEARS